MARIIGGIGTSHVPTIGLAYDQKKQSDPNWTPLFEGYKPVAEWVAKQAPDILICFYNDHATSFFFDNYPTFALGVADSFAHADEGRGARKLPPIPSYPAFARHIAQSLVNDEFDMTIFQDMPVDHGCSSPLTMFAPPAPEWPFRLIPIAINVLQHPLPTARRCYRLGQAVRRAIHSWPEDLKVLVLGTGGLSHQLNGTRAGFNNTEWDLKFLDLIDKDPAALVNMTHADYARLGGTEGAEQIMWLAMRGALSPDAHKIYQSYYLPMTTAMGVAVFEDKARTADEAVPSPGNPQLAGMESLPGSYLFDLERSGRGLRLNRFLRNLSIPERRELFKNDSDAAFEQAALTDEERKLVRELDWAGLIAYGASFFALEKLARVSGVINPQIVANMRGETLETFLKTRNVPGAV